MTATSWIDSIYAKSVPALELPRFRRPPKPERIARNDPDGRRVVWRHDARRIMTPECARDPLRVDTLLAHGAMKD
ncbi:hypothetical protein SAMN04488595_101247 [Ralstonia sp. 25mfcol4.1]|uniref:hypothetical protein n=1 Tax=Ralstonia sp. 25mfcol4.1 TaxID=1761899 RepID=UPI00088EFA32|nr:hypothetical protein [Ralstonia sp. 25mfcol4.1]SDO61995.1 hypothetical protein SAMN04488595_101247 [Ralstonia sp. 25mfcol4.1]